MKRKIATVIAYCGTDFNGSAFNGNSLTVEKVLVDAFLSIGAIKPQNAVCPKKIGLQRASRTDKGVHAAMAVVTLKIEKILTDDDMIALQKFFEGQKIYLYKIVRVSKGFLPKDACNGRIYEYLLPTCVLTPLQEKSHRISAEEHLIIANLFKKYEGTHDFSYFTTANNSKGTTRYIKHIETSEKVLNDGYEYLRIRINGSSFLYNQIRKMIGFAIACYRFQPERADKLFEKALTPKNNIRFNIPKVPGAFLYLDAPVFEYFNKRTQYEKLEVSETDKEEVRQKFVLPNIFTEENIDEFRFWFKIFDVHEYEFSWLHDTVIAIS